MPISPDVGTSALGYKGPRPKGALTKLQVENGQMAGSGAPAHVGPADLHDTTVLTRLARVARDAMVR